MMPWDSPELLSCLLWLIGAFCWVVGYLYPNENSVPNEITNVWRGLMIIFLNFLLIMAKGQSLSIADFRSFKFSLLKGSLTIISAGIFTGVQFYLPLPVVHTINNLAPIVVILLEYLIFGSKINSPQAFGIAVGMAGILIIILNAEQPTRTDFEGYIDSSPFMILLACLALLFGMLCFGFAILTMKQLRLVRPAQIGFYTGLIIFLSNAVVLSSQPHSFHSQDGGVFYKGFLLSGLIFAVGALCELYSLQLWSQSGLILLMEFSTVAWAYVISILRYGEPVNLICLFGVLLTIFGLGKVILASSQKNESEDSILTPKLESKAQTFEPSQVAV